VSRSRPRLGPSLLLCGAMSFTGGCAADPEERRTGEVSPDAPRKAPLPREVLVLERLECHAEGGAEMRLLRGRLEPRMLAHGAAGGEVRVRLLERLLARYRPEREGVDPTDWYCIPRRRLCYSPIAFSDYGGTNAAGDVIDARLADVFDVRYESVPTIAATEYAERCE